jgi:Zn-dependent M28 family amino/carboxypeptidase
VCGFWPGKDPALSKEVVVLSAHYDHVGKQGGEIHNGADDNGSGTSALLAVAEALRSYGPMRRSVLLLWVSGEEKGLWGSGAWTREPTLPEGYRAVCNINVDMVGRNAPDKLLITPTEALAEYNGLTRLAESLGRLEGFPELGSADEYWQRSDHANFSRNLGIPVAFLFSGVHDDYHRPTDDVEKIDCDKIGRVTRLLVRMLEGLQGDQLDL